MTPLRACKKYVSILFYFIIINIYFISIKFNYESAYKKTKMYQIMQIKLSYF